MTKDDLSHEETRSKIGHHRVRREVRKDFSFFVVVGLASVMTFAGGVAPVAARQTYLHIVNVRCCCVTLES